MRETEREREREKVARYLDALSQVLNEGHMLILHRLQTEHFLSGEKKKNERGYIYGTMATDFVLHRTRQTSQALITSHEGVLKSDSQTQWVTTFEM